MVANAWQSVCNAVEQNTARMAAVEDDGDDLRLQKMLLVAVSIIMSSAGIIWGTMYVAFNEPAAAAIPYGYSALSLLNFAWFRLRRNYPAFRFVQLALNLLLPFLLMLVLGGFHQSSAVILWSLLAPLAASLSTERRQAVRWFVAYLALVALGALAEPYLRPANNLPPAVVTVFFVLNISGAALAAFVPLQYFLDQKKRAMELLRQEQEKTHRLLVNVLPESIAAVLKDDNRTIADHFEQVSVLFADVVGFTPLSAKLAPGEMVALLNEIFSYFDALVEKYHLEKIRTIGDNYMAAAGVPSTRPDHAHALARAALEMNDYARTVLAQKDVHLQFRIGLNSGPAVAGVIGQKKFHYDLWGDAVNVASRMESHGIPGKVQIGRGMYDLIKDDFVCVPRGLVEVKGKGAMETWFLEGARS